MAKNETPMDVKRDEPAPAEHRRSPFTALRSEIDRLFDDFDPFSPRSWREGPGAMMRRMSSWEFAPAIDMVEKDDRYVITAEIPGMSEDDIDIRVSGDMLTIRGEKSEEEKKEEKEMRYSERRYGAFQRSFALPESVDRDAISAAADKGVVTVTLPKSKEARASEKKIEVKKA